MSILYVVMAVTAPAVNVEIATITSRQSFIPHIDFSYITTYLYVGLCGWWGRRSLALTEDTWNPKGKFPGMLFSRHGCGLRYPRFVGIWE